MKQSIATTSKGTSQINLLHTDFLASLLCPSVEDSFGVQQLAAALVPAVVELFGESAESLPPDMPSNAAFPKKTVLKLVFHSKGNVERSTTSFIGTPSLSCNFLLSRTFQIFVFLFYCGVPRSVTNCFPSSTTLPLRISLLVCVSTFRPWLQQYC